MQQAQVLACIQDLEAFAKAIDGLLGQPAPYFDPAILPNPSRPEDFPELYRQLRNRAADVLPSDHLPTPEYDFTHGPNLPIQGCFLRKDVEALRRDVMSLIQVLRAVKVLR